MSEARKTKAVANAAREKPTDDQVREIIEKTLDKFNLASDALQALAQLLRFSEADEAHHFMYSPECIGVMVEAMSEVICNSLGPLRNLRADLLIAGSKHHE